MTPEKAQALLDDYTFMRDTGETRENAARRFGCSLSTLDGRLARARKVVRESVSATPENASNDGRIYVTTKDGSGHVVEHMGNPEPDHYQGVAS